MAAPPRRLHANLLFLGLDHGTWSDPPSASNGGAPSPWAKPPWEADSAEHCRLPQPSEQALWDQPGEILNTPSTAVGSSRHGNDLSTDEGSEAKGSESDSLPDSNEGYLVPPQQQFPGVAPAMLPYMSTNAASLCGAAAAGGILPHNIQVPMHTTPAADPTAVYNSYMTPGSFLSTHGFPGSDVANLYGYDVGHSLSTSFQPMGVTQPGALNELGVTQLVPLTDTTVSPDGVPSLGSYAHLSGQCSRCCFHPKGRCSNGYSCEFCHYDHDKRPRNGKKKRYRRNLDGTCEEDLGFLVGGLE